MSEHRNKLADTQDHLIDTLRDLAAAMLALEKMGVKLIDGQWMKPRMVCHNCEDNDFDPIRDEDDNVIYYPIIPAPVSTRAGNGGKDE